MTPEPEIPKIQRAAGLDSIRFVCALIVVFAHTGQPPLRGYVSPDSLVGFVIDGALANLMSSAAAVIVFFVISGFCIHYPFTQSLRIPSLPGYFSRRYIRIGIPVLVAIWISSLVGLSLRLFEGTILWSLAAELIYYSIYPVLLLARRRIGSWLPLIAVSFVAALCVAATNPLSGEYPKFGLQLNWLLGLPCWLAGCQLADHFRNKPVVKPIPWIWFARAGMWLLMMVCMVLRYHTPIGYPWSLNVFALIAAVWINFELTHMGARKPWGWLEHLGVWSYSLYLTHKLAVIVYDWFSVPSLGVWGDWALRLGFILLFAYGFYLICEKPAHFLARSVGRWAERQNLVRRDRLAEGKKP